MKMGINMNDAFPSKWLKAADVGDDDILVTMRNVTMEEVADGERKPVLWLEGYDKGVVLNKTNGTNISQLYGPDSDGWIGRQMTLSTAWVDFNGKSTLSLRLYPPRKQGFVSGARSAPQNDMDSDPRGDVPPPSGPNDYGAQRG
jgi:hypothetical protein